MKATLVSDSGRIPSCGQYFAQAIGSSCVPHSIVTGVAHPQVRQAGTTSHSSSQRRSEISC